MSENLQRLLQDFDKCKPDNFRRAYVVADILAELGAIHNTPQAKQNFVASIRRPA